MENYHKIENRWNEMMYGIGRKELWVFEGNNIAYTENLIETNCRRHLMRWIYHTLVNHKKIIRIEDLEHDIKLKMWAFVKEVCEGKTSDITIMKEVAMVFYTLEYFMNEKEQA